MSSMSERKIKQNAGCSISVVLIRFVHDIQGLCLTPWTSALSLLLWYGKQHETSVVNQVWHFWDRRENPEAVSCNAALSACEKGFCWALGQGINDISQQHDEEYHFKRFCKWTCNRLLGLLFCSPWSRTFLFRKTRKGMAKTGQLYPSGPIKSRFGDVPSLTYFGLATESVLIDWRVIEQSCWTGSMVFAASCKHI